MGASTTLTRLGDPSERLEIDRAQRRVLVVCALDVMAWKLLLPCLRRLLGPERLVGRLVVRVDGASLWF